MEQTVTTTAPANTPGCSNCNTGSCNKLNVFNWLSDMALPPGQKPFDIVEVRFKGSRKEFYRNTNLLNLKEGDMVAVEATGGHDIGMVSIVGELVKLQLKKKHLDIDSPEIKALYRAAKPGDIDKWNDVKALEVNTMYESRKICSELGLSMKLSDVEFQGDGKKATFFYTAEERVDFRELIRRLGEKFKVRVEMRQIGMRQEASRLGGIGSCGRELCCSTWLTEFKVVQTNAARYQNLSINQVKLAGQCGKLKCCLNYELESYLDAIKQFPEPSVKLETVKGNAHHIKTDIFKRLMWYAYDIQRGPDGEIIYNASEKWIMLHVDRVKEIIETNKQGLKAEDLMTFVEKPEFTEKPIVFSDVVGQDSINRMDKKKSSKHKKKQGQGQNAAAGQQPGQPQKQAGGQPQQQAQPKGPRPPQQARPPQNKPVQAQPSGQGQPQNKPAPSGQQQRPQHNQQRKPNNPNQDKSNNPSQQNKPAQGQQPRQPQQNRPAQPQTPKPNAPTQHQPPKPPTPPAENNDGNTSHRPPRKPVD